MKITDLTSQEIILGIGLITAVLGLIVIVLKLILHIKQIKRENTLEKKRKDEETQKKITELENLRLEEKRQKEILEKTVLIVSDFIEDELPNKLKPYAKLEELSVIKRELKSYLEKEFEKLKSTENIQMPDKRGVIEKSLAEAFGINVYNLKPPGKI